MKKAPWFGASDLMSVNSRKSATESM